MVNVFLNAKTALNPKGASSATVRANQLSHAFHCRKRREPKKAVRARRRTAFSYGCRPGTTPVPPHLCPMLMQLGKSEVNALPRKTTVLNL
jgi:hypothetical protein